MATIRWLAGFAGLALLVGCGHGPASTTIVVSAEPAQLIPPSNPNDAQAWNRFLSKAIVDVTHDAKLHPYSFVVPEGEAADATERRKSEATAIRSMLGHTAVPGNLIALSGPDSTKVAEVVTQAFQGLPAHTAQGLTVLFVGVPAAAESAKKTVSVTGAELHVRAMRALGALPSS